MSTPSMASAEVWMRAFAARVAVFDHSPESVRFWTTVRKPLGIVGCTEAEIARVRDVVGLSLPAMYRAFLTVMGRDAGGLLRGSDVFYPFIVEYPLREGLEELLFQSHVEPPLPRDALVFLSHQGYIFDYMLAAAGDDPPVYGYQEGDPAPRRTHERFSAFLEGHFEHLRKIIESSQRQAPAT